MWSKSVFFEFFKDIKSQFFKGQFRIFLFRVFFKGFAEINIFLKRKVAFKIFFIRVLIVKLE